MTNAPNLFVVVLTYVAPLDEVDAAGKDHVAWLERGYDRGVFLASGRRVPRTGGIILASAASMEEVQAWMRQDPFQSRGLATAEVFPFEVNMMSGGMKAAIAAAVQLGANEKH
ncbi:YciI family protein [Achromobacter piechaudii]|uniref:YciI family protein n=1 Tax=Achromobacter piechaudii TaxID=72556 RepID=UPI001582C15D|nr:YciI family protein [Achromobacter piechaudii]